MKVLSTLTSRLVLTAVALVALVCVVIAVLTTVAMDHQLTQRLDSDVRALAHGPAAFGGPVAPDHLDVRNRGPRSLVAFIPSASGSSGTSVTASGFVLGSYPGDREQLSAAALDRLGSVSADGDPHAVDLPGAGGYRVLAQPTRLQDATTGAVASGELVVGLPTSDVDSTIHNLVWWEVVLTLLGVLVAASVGTAVVRRQLRPLNEVARTAHAVAALPLGAGETAIAERVPERLTDPRTETGQVGAALNTLLDHVESSLDARHRSEQQVRQFVADASHELRTPLTTIGGYTELARRHPEAAGTALAKVEEESRRMTALVEDLLLLARLDAGRPLDLTPVDLSRLLTEAVADARVVGPEHHWRIEQPGRPVEVLGDAGRLHQVVTNLLTNARKHTPAGTTVTVRMTAGGFDVCDDGPGIPPDLAAVVFQRFRRGDAGRQREGGVGLGLALVDAIVHAHGGSVRLVSRPGDTRFEVRLAGGPGMVTAG